MQKLEINAKLCLQRSFEVWAYVTTHKQLLLRSNRSKEMPSRVDVLFKLVSWMSLPSRFEYLEIRYGDDDDLRLTRITLGSKSITDQRIFLLDGGRQKGVVVAEAMYWHEDNGSYGDPSPLAKYLFVIGGGQLP